jgi:hypothetical protein
LPDVLHDARDVVDGGGRADLAPEGVERRGACLAAARGIAWLRTREVSSLVKTATTRDTTRRGCPAASSP